jgi:hypothetical protein
MLFYRNDNGLKHTVDIAQNLVVPETEYKVAHGFQHLGSRGIAIRFIGVLSSVDLNDEMGLLTAEIDDVFVDG